MDNQNINNQAAQDKTVEIDLVELARAVWHRFWLVIILAAVGAILAFGITKAFITPKYESKATIYILSKSTSITSLADLQIGSNLAADFEIIAKTRELLERVIEEQGLDFTYEQLRSEIAVSNPTNSHMLVITVNDPDPVQSALIANVVADELRDEIANVMNTDRPSAVEQAVVAENPKSPSVSRNVIIGAIVGIIIALIIIIAIFMSDDTIKTSDDVRKYLGLDTLASFPMMKGMGKTRGSQSGKKKKSNQP